MSFFFPELRRSVSARARRDHARVSIELLHQLECKACPLDKVVVQSPKMEPTGASTPLIYILGEAPGAVEDQLNEQFVGESGQLLRQQLPSWAVSQIRWNNCVRTRPPHNRTPEMMEIEACRPSIERDIQASKPKVVFGFGGIPLQWMIKTALSDTRTHLWRGRRFPVSIGTWCGWYYPHLHPAFILRKQSRDQFQEYERDGEEDRLDYALIFRLDLQRAFQELDALPEPWVPTRDEALAGLESITGTTEADLQYIQTRLEEFSLLAGEYVGIDFETTALRPYDQAARLLCMSVSTRDRGISFLVDHPKAAWPSPLRQRLRRIVSTFLAQSSCIKTAHNIAFELEWAVDRFGVDWYRQSQDWACTMAGAYVLDERKDGHSLEFVVFELFGFNVKGVMGMNQTQLIQEELSDLLLYNALDAKWCAWAAYRQWPRIQAQGLESAYHEQVRRVFTTVLTQRKGLCVDFELVETHYQRLSQEILAVTERILQHPDIQQFTRVMGTTFNPQSVPDVVALFDRILQRPEGKEGKKYSTDESVLKRIDHPIAEGIVQLRGLVKLRSTYIESLRKDEGKHIYPDGRIHTTLNTTFTMTGRLSSDGPNIQNFPHRENPWIRCVIITPQKKACQYKLVACDYGQIEARVIAMYSKDKFMIEAMSTKYDIHMEWAERWATEYPTVVGGKRFRTDKGVMKKFRSEIKNQFVFPCFYGAGPPSIARSLNAPRRITEQLWGTFWQTFPGVKRWQERVLAQYQQEGFVERFGGWRRHGPLTTNMIINTPIQGSSSDIVVDAMNRLSEQEVEDGEDWNQAVMNIHDDLEFYLPVYNRDTTLERILQTMLFSPCSWVNVPLSVEVSMGDNWGDLKEVGAFFSNEW